ncbi:hypothetical protein L207DRAFT_635387 [Hyaloscypha variabilis F]|uniref:Zn(2)-C6 fungal-type domain-containing protein n=1 Tax=Hyaloscypha variabilis (strain UAMH 11265 / GT02V1 / F) TaxID=1149755 RepID=A0A2J6RHF7_HYAVF|nr:hypothetical protein L207DRAFT_635387 [Hyaloscypha variabilis F]
MERPFPEPELSHPKKPRASKPKVKSGCHTCKSRRVKCDETKPNCLRCANFGRRCGGYASKEDTPPKEPVPTTKRRLLSKATAVEYTPEPSPSLDARFALLSSNPSPAQYIPSIPPGITFEDEAELQYLCHFRDVTSIELSGGFSPTMWNTVILQACDSPEIRRLTIATAAMSMAASSTPQPGMHWNTTPEYHRQYAFQKYGEALKAIQQKIVRSCSDSVKTAMISALLIFCFESFQGDVSPTMMHIQSALEVIVKKLSSEPHAYQFPIGFLGSQGNDPIDRELLMAFMRIDRPSLSLLCRQKGQTPRPAGRIFSLIFPQEPFEIPNTFLAIEEARIYLDDIRWRMFPGADAPESMSALWQNDEGEDLSPDIGAVPWHVQKWYQSYETPVDCAIISQRLALWHDAFSPLLNFAMTPAGDSMFIPAATIHIQALTTDLVLTGFFPPSFTNHRSSSFSNFHSSPFDKPEPITHVVSGSLSVPPSVPSRGRSSSHSSPQPTQENMRLFPTVHAILDFSRRLVAHPRFSKGFVFDIGIISSLSVVVMLCPDRGLRREAVEVLKEMRPRREGVWDSRVCAEAGEKSIVKEESEMELIDPSLR